MKVPITKWTLLAFFTFAVMIHSADSSIRSRSLKSKFDDDDDGLKTGVNSKIKTGTSDLGGRFDRFGRAFQLNTKKTNESISTAKPKHGSAVKIEQQANSTKAVSKSPNDGNLYKIANTTTVRSVSALPDSTLTAANPANEPTTPKSPSAEETTVKGINDMTTTSEDVVATTFSSVNLIEECKGNIDIEDCVREIKEERINKFQQECEKWLDFKSCLVRAESQASKSDEVAEAALGLIRCDPKNQSCVDMEATKVKEAIIDELRVKCEQNDDCLNEGSEKAEKSVDSLKVAGLGYIPECTSPTTDSRCPVGFSSFGLIKQCKDQLKYEECVEKEKAKLLDDWKKACKSSTTCASDAEKRANVAEKVAKQAAQLIACSPKDQNCTDTETKKMKDAIFIELKVKCAQTDTKCMEDATKMAEKAVNFFSAFRTSSSTATTDFYEETSPSEEPPESTTVNPLDDKNCVDDADLINGYCDNLCVTLGNGGYVEKSTVDYEAITTVLWIIFAILVIANIVFAIYSWRDRCKKRAAESTPSDEIPDRGAKLREAYAKAAEAKKNPQQKPDKSSEVPSPPSDKNSAHRKMRAKLLETQANLLKLRNHVKKTTAQHKSDIRSKKFKKMGPIYIPMEPEITPAAPLPDNIVLENVEYDPTGNEMYDIGSDVDDIELDSSLIIDANTLTEEESDKDSKKSKRSKKGSKKSKKESKKGSKKSGKSKKDDEKKKDGKEPPEIKTPKEEGGEPPKDGGAGGKASDDKTKDNKADKDKSKEQL